MKEIPLTQGFATLINDEDFDLLNQWKWFVFSNNQGNFYAGRHEWIEGRNKRILMHRVILRAPEGWYVDHRNHQTLDNQRINLRICSNRQNQHNCVLRKDSSSGFKGVSWDANRKKYQAQIKLNGRTAFLGRFNDLKEAAKAYNDAALQHHGEFACLNPL